jgi:indole-3-glycerol phosphate synthase
LGNILEQIVTTKRSDVTRARARRPVADLKRTLGKVPAPWDFLGLIAALPPHGVHLIAEMKRRSPSAGLIRPEYDPEQIARAYYEAGASALSVLTDEVYFEGRLEHIELVKATVALPVLRKDFLVDPYQVYESRAAGADCILLIGEVLPPAELHEMLDISYDLGMATLIEVHTQETLEALQREIGFPNDKRSLLGINNRDLTVQRTDLETTRQLAALVGPGTVLVSESGIRTRSDVEQVRAAGAHAILVGETLMRATDIPEAIRQLLGA